MPARINTRLVVPLLLALAVITAGGIALSYISVRRSATWYAQRAEQAVQIGDWKTAEEFYSKAVNREQGNIELLDRWVEVMAHVVPETEIEAQRYEQMYNQVLKRKTEMRPFEAQFHLDWLARIHEITRPVPPIEDCIFLSEQASIMLNSRPPGDDDPRWKEGRRYRGIADALRSRDTGLDEDLRARALEDLEFALERDPSDADAAAAMILWHAFDGRVLLERNRRAEAWSRLDAARRFADQFLQANPEALTVWLTRAALPQLAANWGFSSDAIDRASAAAALDVAEELALAAGPDTHPLPWWAALIFAGDVMVMDADVPRAHRRALRVLDHAIALAPSTHHPRLLLESATILHRMGDREAALATFQQVVDHPLLPVSREATQLFRLRPVAILAQFDIDIDNWRTALAGSEGARGREGEGVISPHAAVLDRLDQYRSLTTPTDPQLLYMEGRIALTDRRPADAAARLNQFLNRSNPAALRTLQHLSALVDLSVALQQIGQPGAARQHLHQADQLAHGRHAPIVAQLISLDLRRRDLDAAQRNLDRLTQLDPDHPAIPAHRNRLSVLTTMADGGTGVPPVQEVGLPARHEVVGLEAQPPAHATGLTRTLLEAHALMAADDLDGARTLLTQARQGDHTPAQHAALYLESARLEHAAGNPDEALRIVALGLHHGAELHHGDTETRREAGEGGRGAHDPHDPPPPSVSPRLRGDDPPTPDPRPLTPDLDRATEMLRIYQAVLDPEVSLQQVLEEIIDSRTHLDPTDRHLTAWALLRQFGLEEEAQPHYQQARALNPDHPVVLEHEFMAALGLHHAGVPTPLQGRGVPDTEPWRKAGEPAGGAHDPLPPSVSGTPTPLKGRGDPAPRLRGDDPLTPDPGSLTPDGVPTPLQGRGVPPGPPTPDLDRAADIARRAAALNIDHATGLTYRGRLELAQGNHAAAIDSLTQAAALKPYDAAVHRLLGVAYRTAGNYPAALQSLTTALECDPLNVATLREQAHLHLLRQEWPEALSVTRQAHQLAPHDVPLTALYLDLEGRYGDPHHAIEIRQRHHRRHPNDLANTLALSDLHARAGNHEQAEALLASLRPQTPAETLQVARTWAEVHLSRGDEMSARQVFDELIRSDDMSTEALLEAHLTFAALLAEIGAYDEAVAALEDAQQYQDPQRREADRALGTLHRTLGDLDAALTVLEPALSHQPEARDLSIDVINLHYRLALNVAEVDESRSTTHRRRAGTLLDEHERRHGRSHESVLLRGGLAILDKATEQAERLFNQAVTSWPQNRAVYIARARFNLQMILEHDELARITRLEQDVEQAMMLNPVDPEPILLLAELAAARRDPTTGEPAPDIDALVGYCDRILAITPNNDSVRIRLVEALFMRQRFDAAANRIEQAIELNPDRPDWHEIRGDLELRRGALAAAIPHYRRALARGAAASLLHKTCQTLLSVQPRRTEEALRLLDEHAALVSGNARLQMVRAKCLGAMQRTDEAADVLRAAGSTLRELVEPTQREAAIREWFEALVQSVPHTEFSALTDAAFGEGDDLIPQVRLAEALMMAASMTERDQRRSLVDEALSRLMRVQRELDAADPTSAQRDPAAPDLRPLVREVGFILGNIHYGRSDYADAIAAWRWALSVAPNDPILNNNLAFALASRMNDPKGALEPARLAVEQAPDDASILDTYGYVLFRNEMLDEAEHYLRESLERRDQAMTRKHLAEVLLRRGQEREAVENLRRARELADSVRDVDLVREIDDMLGELTRDG